MSRKTGHTVYVVCWRESGIVKAGYTEYQRWQVFTHRGAELVARLPFEDVGTALDFESDIHLELRRIGSPAFATRAESLPYLGTGGGYLECFRVTDALLQALLQALLVGMQNRREENRRLRTDGVT